MTGPAQAQLRPILNKRENELRTNYNKHLSATSHVIRVGVGPAPVCQSCVSFEASIAEVIHLRTTLCPTRDDALRKRKHT